MMQRVARPPPPRALPMLAIPLLTPRLSSHWLAFVTDVDTRTARNLVDSMSNEVVVLDHSIEEVVPGEPLDYTSAIEEAYAARARARAEGKKPRSEGHDGAPRDAQRPTR